jgi:hypothetical protein
MQLNHCKKLDHLYQKNWEGEAWMERILYNCKVANQDVENFNDLDKIENAWKS